VRSVPAGLPVCVANHWSELSPGITTFTYYQVPDHVRSRERLLTVSRIRSRGLISPEVTRLDQLRFPRWGRPRSWLYFAIGDASMGQREIFACRCWVGADGGAIRASIASERQARVPCGVLQTPKILPILSDTVRHDAGSLR